MSSQFRILGWISHQIPPSKNTHLSWSKQTFSFSFKTAFCTNSYTLLINSQQRIIEKEWLRPQKFIDVYTCNNFI